MGIPEARFAFVKRDCAVRGLRGDQVVDMFVLERPEFLSADIVGGGFDDGVEEHSVSGESAGNIGFGFAVMKRRGEEMFHIGLMQNFSGGQLHAGADFSAGADSGRGDRLEFHFAFPGKRSLRIMRLAAIASLRLRMAVISGMSARSITDSSASSHSALSETASRPSSR